MAIPRLIWTCWYRLVRKCCQKGILTIVLLSLIVLSMYAFSTRVTEMKKINTNGPIYALLQGNGSRHIDDIEELLYLSEDEKAIMMRKMRILIEGHVKRCTSNLSDNECELHNNGKAVLTLFTTWIYDKEKFGINNKTLNNWKKLPQVNLVVFSNDTDVLFHSLRAGWHVLPVTREAANAPILPLMFEQTMANFDSTYYGYANGDLLFTGNLIQTLQKILCEMISKSEADHILIVGKRTNIEASLISNSVAVSWTQLEDYAIRFGDLFQGDAEDYFITDRHYPWNKFLPVVVGRRGYDNWVVAYSRLHNITVIDATETILCLHQTLESRGNYEGLNKGTYNIDMLEKLNLPFGIGKWGKTDCGGFKTWYDLCKQIIIRQRKTLNPYCTSHYWLHTFYKIMGLVN